MRKTPHSKDTALGQNEIASTTANTKANHLPMQPQNALNYMCKISQSLLDLAERESQALVQNDVMSLAVLQDEKDDLSERYMAASEEFRSRINEFRKVDKSLIRRLEDLQKKLSERSNDNNVLVSQIRDRAERNTQKTLLIAQEYGQSPRAYFPGTEELAASQEKGA